MINKEILQKSRDYVLNHMEELHFGSVPTPMFVDGKFNPNNWNGGDSAIRQFFYEIMDSSNGEEEYSNKDVTMRIEYTYEDDDNNVELVVTKDSIKESYKFSWYKSRGKTDSATLNGRDLTEDKYIELLNTIESLAEFKFSFRG